MKNSKSAYKKHEAMKQKVRKAIEMYLEKRAHPFDGSLHVATPCYYGQPDGQDDYIKECECPIDEEEIYGIMREELIEKDADMALLLCDYDHAEVACPESDLNRDDSRIWNKQCTVLILREKVGGFE